jgi:sterol desaturase/sphingolipid hydroxylase (fatty acid hydroxylase superfamily)
MSIIDGLAGDRDRDDRPMSREWHWHPDLPIGTSPLFTWPPSPHRIFRWLARSWLTLSPITLWLALSVVIWVFLHPEVERMARFEGDWIAELYLRNALLMIATAGGLQLYFYRLGRQGKRRKFDARDLARNHRGFTWGSQVRDNVFWSLGSGVAVWTAYEAVYIWAYANGYLPGLVPADNPVWFVAFFLLIPVWSSMHFYWVHRFLHWPPVYKRVHALHHRNINIGPWSGLAMHPIEHLLYFSTLAIHFVVPSHPIHVLFHLLIQALNPLCSHCGFESLTVKGKRRLALGDFFHQLHHRYFECNYGTAEMPWDKWFGSFHDGTEAAAKRIRERQRRARKAAKAAA